MTDANFKYSEYVENKYKGSVGYIPYLKSGDEWSMLKVFGTLPPYTPEVFTKLCTRTKWVGKCIEAENGFCTECGCLTSSVPNTHHKECSSYREQDVYPKVDPYLGGCPDCHEEGEDNLSIYSSREQGLSIISCSLCGFSYSGNMCEEDLEEQYLKEKL